MKHIQIIAKTDKGRTRAYNEDDFFVEASICPTNSSAGAVVAIADGVGGMNAGEIASKIAVQSVQEYFRQICREGEKIGDHTRYLRGAILYAHENILARAISAPETQGMGTTLVVAWLVENQLRIGWSGDSRCYCYRPSTGLRQLSRDHSYVQSLVDAGELLPEQAVGHPHSNVILQALGDSEHPPSPDFAEQTLCPGDLILLCTDGLNTMLDDGAIEGFLRKHGDSIENCADELIAAANTAGGFDNITVALLKMPESDAPLVSATESPSSLSTTESPPVVPISAMPPERIKRGNRGLRISLLLLFFLGIGSGWYLGFFSKNYDSPPIKIEQQRSHPSIAPEIATGQPLQKTVPIPNKVRADTPESSPPLRPKLHVKPARERPSHETATTPAEIAIIQAEAPTRDTAKAAAKTTQFDDALKKAQQQKKQPDDNNDENH